MSGRSLLPVVSRQDHGVGPARSNLGRAITSAALLLGSAACTGQDGAGRAEGCTPGPFLAVAGSLEEGLAEIVLYGDDEAQVLDRGNVTTEPDFSPDGRRLAYVLANGDFESSGPASTEIWTAETNGEGAQQVVPAELMVTSPEWSPDGRVLAYIGHADGRFELRTVDVGSGVTSMVLRLDGVDIHQPTWSPDGSQLAFLTSEYDEATFASTVRVATSAADGSEYRTVAAIPDASWLTWYPDGRSLLVSTLGAEDGMISRLDIADGTMTELASSATMAELGPSGSVFYLERSDTSPLWRVVQGSLQEDRIVRTRVIDDEPRYAYPYFGMSARDCVE